MEMIGNLMQKTAENTGKSMTCIVGTWSNLRFKSVPFHIQNVCGNGKIKKLFLCT